MSSKKRSAKSANKLDGTRKRFQAEKKASTERLETEVKTLRAKLEAEKKASKERLEAELKTLREKLEAKVKTLSERLEAEKKATRKKLDDEKKRLRVEFEARLAKSEEELKKKYSGRTNILATDSSTQVSRVYRQIERGTIRELVVRFSRSGENHVDFAGKFQLEIRLRSQPEQYRELAQEGWIFNL